MTRILYTLFTFLFFQNARAQSIGVGTSTPHASALVHVSSATQGILAPRLSSAQRSAIANPATGLLVFQTDGAPGYCYYSGFAWISLTHGYALNSQGKSIYYGAVSTLGVDDIRNPSSVGVDASGNVYVADFNRIRKITPGGVVTALAGSANAGFADGAGAAAAFNTPDGIAVDVLGNVYVGDTFNHAIRKITPGGVVTTLAGSANAGFADGAGTAAAFNLPRGIAVDVSGNLYVADSYNSRIRKITAGGVVTTLAGSGVAAFADGAGSSAAFNYPWGIAVDASGNVYVGDYGNNRIRKITAGGVVTTLAGGGNAVVADGAGTAAAFHLPTGITVDVAGNVYVADLANNAIRKITAGGLVTTLAGGGVEANIDAIGLAAAFHLPTGVAVDVAGNLYVADTYNRSIRKIITY